MKLYHLSVTFALTPLTSYGGAFDFVAINDDEARLFVEKFTHVCQPQSFGPLYCIGEPQIEGGPIIRYDDERDCRVVPLEIRRV